MCSQALQTIVAPLRAYGPVVLEAVDDPHAEVMALVWGPRFDRDSARALLDRYPGYVPQVLQSVQCAADRFDQLPAPQQQHLRKLIVRHRRRWDNAANTH